MQFSHFINKINSVFVIFIFIFEILTNHKTKNVVNFEQLGPGTCTTVSKSGDVRKVFSCNNPKE